MEYTATDAAIVTVVLIVLRQVFEVAAKTIPDTATGWQAGVRKLFKALAVYVPNKE